MRLNNLTAEDVKLILLSLEQVAGDQRDAGDAEGIEFAEELDELIDRALQQTPDGNLIPEHYHRKHKRANAA